MSKKLSDKGISLLIAIGSYGGFFITRNWIQSQSIHICIGWIAITLFFYDVENRIAKIIESEKEDNPYLLTGDELISAEEQRKRQ